MRQRAREVPAGVGRKAPDRLPGRMRAPHPAGPHGPAPARRRSKHAMGLDLVPTGNNRRKSSVVIEIEGRQTGQSTGATRPQAHSSTACCPADALPCNYGYVPHPVRRRHSGRRAGADAAGADPSSVIPRAPGRRAHGDEAGGDEMRADRQGVPRLRPHPASTTCPGAWLDRIGYFAGALRDLEAGKLGPARRLGRTRRSAPGAVRSIQTLRGRRRKPKFTGGRGPAQSARGVGRDSRDLPAMQRLRKAARSRACPRIKLDGVAAGRSDRSCIPFPSFHSFHPFHSIPSIPFPDVADAPARRPVALVPISRTLRADAAEHAIRNCWEVAARCTIASSPGRVGVVSHCAT